MMEWIILRIGSHCFVPQGFATLKRYIAERKERKHNLLFIFDSLSSVKHILSYDSNNVELIQQLQSELFELLHTVGVTPLSSPPPTSSLLDLVKWVEVNCRNAVAVHFQKFGIETREVAAVDLYHSNTALLKESQSECLVTEGSIGIDDSGRELLLKGAADESCARFAKLLCAARIEVFSQQGIFTADTALIPAAYHLKHLHYTEAKEILQGIPIFHPEALDVVKKSQIPIHIRSFSSNAEIETVIEDSITTSAVVKAVSVVKDLVLLSPFEELDSNSENVLQQVMSALQQLKCSFELNCNSNRLSVCLHSKYKEDLLKLTDNLKPKIGEMRVRQCSSVSLIGHCVSASFYSMAAALKIFQEHENYLMFTSSNDTKMSFLVAAETGASLAVKLHAALFADTAVDTRIFGAPFNELFASDSISRVKHRVKRNWWLQRRDDLLALSNSKSPVYVYNEDTLQEAVDALKSITAVDRIFFAIKANSNPDILRYFYNHHLSFECVSPGEVDLILKLFPEIDRERILFTPNFAPKQEYIDAFAKGVLVTVDSKYPLQHWSALFKGKEIFLRIDPGRGDGHHKHVHTAGKQSKFGISSSDIEEVAELVSRIGAKVIGLHSHLGSGIYTTHAWFDTATFLASLHKYFPHLKILDLGGGLGVIERDSQPELDLDEVNQLLLQFKSKWNALQIWIEPGRYLVALAGVLLTKVTQLKSKEGVNYVGVDTGFNSLIRPVLYGAFHEILNLSKLHEPPTITAEVVGVICESGDVFGHNRRLPVTEENDTILIATTGAYGYSMSSFYNMRTPAEQIMLKSIKNVQ